MKIHTILKNVCTCFFTGVLFFNTVTASPTPSPSPDQYENDNSADTASEYYLYYPEYQYHNFHEPGDEDWVRISVTRDMGVLTIQTREPEANCETIVSLFDTDKTTLLKEQTFTLSNGINEISHKILKSGTYYIRIRNKDPSVFGNETGYKLFIFSPQAPISGSITGIVTDTSTGLPLDGVNIRLGNNLAGATTASDGHYFIIGPAGQMTLYAAKTGYHEFSQHVDIDEAATKSLDISLRPETADPKEYAHMDATLAITIPCIGFQGGCYRMVLNYAAPLSGSGEAVWKLDMNSLGIGQNCGSYCALLDDSLQITIPKMTFQGNLYQLNLKPFVHPDDPSGLYWKLDLYSS